MAEKKYITVRTLLIFFNPVIIVVDEITFYSRQHLAHQSGFNTL